MNELAIRYLAEGIHDHVGVTGFRLEPTVETLMKTQIGETSKFYTTVPENSQSSSDPADREYSFSLDFILKNRNLGKPAKLSAAKALWEKVNLFFNHYDPAVAVRNLRQDTDISSIIKKCKDPFSLFGTLTVTDIHNEEGAVLKVSPVLYVPGLERDPRVKRWENGNTFYGKENTSPIRLLLPVQKIPPAEYFSH